MLAWTTIVVCWRLLLLLVVLVVLVVLLVLLVLFVAVYYVGSGMHVILGHSRGLPVGSKILDLRVSTSISDRN